MLGVQLSCQCGSIFIALSKHFCNKDRKKNSLHKNYILAVMILDKYAQKHLYEWPTDHFHQGKTLINNNHCMLFVNKCLSQESLQTHKVVNCTMLETQNTQYIDNKVIRFQEPYE